MSVLTIFHRAFWIRTANCAVMALLPAAMGRAEHGLPVLGRPCVVPVVDGILRARYRETFTRQTPIEPGRIYEYSIDLWSLCHAFKRGHRIQVEISSSNFPKYDRNPNTGHAFGTDTVRRVAEQTIYHDSRAASHVVLPVISRRTN